MSVDTERLHYPTPEETSGSNEVQKFVPESLLGVESELITLDALTYMAGLTREERKKFDSYDIRQKKIAMTSHWTTNADFDALSKFSVKENYRGLEEFMSDDAQDTKSIYFPTLNTFSWMTEGRFRRNLPNFVHDVTGQEIDVPRLKQRAIRLGKFALSKWSTDTLDIENRLLFGDKKWVVGSYFNFYKK